MAPVQLGGRYFQRFGLRRHPIGVLGSTGIAAAATRGVNMQLFWILDNIGHSEALVVRKESGISKPEDLKGKRIGVPFVSTSHFHLLVALSKVWKMNPRDVRILNMQPPQIVAAWQRGDIDAAYVWPPALTTLLKDGTVLTDSEEVGKASVPTFDGIVVDKAWAEKIRNSCRLILKSWPMLTATITRIVQSGAKAVLKSRVLPR